MNWVDRIDHFSRGDIVSGRKTYYYYLTPSEREIGHTTKWGLYQISSNGLGGAVNDTIDVSGVPEPSTWAMLGIGFAAMGFVGFRKARARSAISIG